MSIDQPLKRGGCLKSEQYLIKHTQQLKISPKKGCSLWCNSRKMDGKVHLRFEFQVEHPNQRLTTTDLKIFLTLIHISYKNFQRDTKDFKVIYKCWKLVDYFWKWFSFNDIRQGQHLLLMIFFNVPNFCGLCWKVW